MGIRATGSFEVKSWDEQPYSESEGGSKLTRASVTNAFQGDIEGEGTLAYLMVYREDGADSFVGLEQVVGHVGGRAGSFVLQHGGTFAGDTMRPPGLWRRARGPGSCVACGARVASSPGTGSGKHPSRSTTTSRDGLGG